MAKAGGYEVGKAKKLSKEAMFLLNRRYNELTRDQIITIAKEWDQITLIKELINDKKKDETLEAFINPASQKRNIFWEFLTRICTPEGESFPLSKDARETLEKEGIKFNKNGIRTDADKNKIEVSKELFDVLKTYNEKLEQTIKWFVCRFKAN